MLFSSIKRQEYIMIRLVTLMNSITVNRKWVTFSAYPNAAGVALSGRVATRSASAGASRASTSPHLLRTEYTCCPVGVCV